MKNRFAFVMILILLLSGSFGHVAAESGFPTAKTATVQTLDLPRGDGFLSPDGAHIFLIASGPSAGDIIPVVSGQTRTRSLCIYSAAGEQEVCGEVAVLPDVSSVRWSPDSRWIAFSDNFFRNFLEPDIWVMDATTGKITDVTDDQIIKYKLNDLKSLPSIDVVPTWTADSKQVLFIRYHPGEADPAQAHTEKAGLYQVPPEGGEAVEVGTLKVSASTPPFPTYALSLAPDGKNIAYNVDVAKKTEAANGLWVADPDGKNPRQILKVFGMVSADYSADGRFLLGLNGIVLGQYLTSWDQTVNTVVALDGDKELAVDSERAARYAAWSPKGAALVYIWRNLKQPEQDGLYVVDEPGKAGQQVYKGAVIPSAPTANWRSLYWATNDTVLVQTLDRKFLLVQLGGEELTMLCADALISKESSIMKVRRILGVAFVIFLCGAFIHFAAAESALPVPEMATAQTLDLPQGDAYLSPDGAHILLMMSGGISLCVYSAAGQKETCGEFGESPDFNSIRWSPDSKWVAFTEDFNAYWLEPDIWVMDAQTGKITNLTDDQLAKIKKLSDLELLPSIDVAPTWTGDSKQIRFIRYHSEELEPGQSHNHKADLYQVSPEGGKAVQIGSLIFPPDTPLLSADALALAPDGKQIAYSVPGQLFTNHTPTNVEDGMWVADVDGRNPRQVLHVYGIVDVAFSSDGRFLRGLNINTLESADGTFERVGDIVIALDGDKKMPVDSERAALWTAWSPTGAALVYIVYNPKQPEQNGLYLADEPGKAGKQVYAGTITLPTPGTVERGLYWAANNTLLVRTMEWKFLLLHLDTK